MFRLSVISPNATYALSRSGAVVDEGSSITITVHTTGVQTGQAIPYTITGISAADIDQPLTGVFSVMNGVASKLFNVNTDMLVEGDEVFTLLLDDAGEEISVTVHDTTQLVQKPAEFDRVYFANTSAVKSSQTTLYTGITSSWGGNAQVVTATAKTSGKWYYEARVTGSQYVHEIITSPGLLWYGSNPLQVAVVHTSKEANGVASWGSGTLTVYSPMVDGVVYGVMVDLDGDIITIVQSGQVKATVTGLPVAVHTSGVVSTFTTWNMGSSASIEFNLGQNDFVYAMPSGYDYLGYGG